MIPHNHLIHKFLNYCFCLHLKKKKITFFSPLQNLADTPKWEMSAIVEDLSLTVSSFNHFFPSHIIRGANSVA